MTKHEHDIQISRTQKLPFDLKIFLKFEMINEYGILFSITQTLFFPSLCLGFKITWLERANGSHIACVSHAWHPTHTHNVFSRFLRENEQCEPKVCPLNFIRKLVHRYLVLPYWKPARSTAMAHAFSTPPTLAHVIWPFTP